MGVISMQSPVPVLEAVVLDYYKHNGQGAKQIFSCGQAMA